MVLFYIEDATVTSYETHLLLLPVSQKDPPSASRLVRQFTATVCDWLEAYPRRDWGWPASQSQVSKYGDYCQNNQDKTETANPVERREVGGLTYPTILLAFCLDSLSNYLNVEHFLLLFLNFSFLCFAVFLTIIGLWSGLFIKMADHWNRGKWHVVRCDGAYYVLLTHF